MNLSREALKKIVGAVAMTLPEEIGCEECFEQLDKFAELVLSGKPIGAAMPLVQQHLERCGDCREEFEALLSTLMAIT